MCHEMAPDMYIGFRMNSVEGGYPVLDEWYGCVLMRVKPEVFGLVAIGGGSRGHCDFSECALCIEWIWLGPGWVPC